MDEETNTSYLYVKNGKEYITPNRELAFKRTELDVWEIRSDDYEEV